MGLMDTGSRNPFGCFLVSKLPSSFLCFGGSLFPFLVLWSSFSLPLKVDVVILHLKRVIFLSLFALRSLFPSFVLAWAFSPFFPLGVDVYHVTAVVLSPRLVSVVPALCLQRVVFASPPSDTKHSPETRPLLVASNRRSFSGADGCHCTRLPMNMFVL